MEDATTDKQVLALDNMNIRALLDVVPVGIAIVDVAGQIVEINEAMRKIWGGTEDVDECAAMCEGWWPESGERLNPQDWPHAHVLKTGKSALARAIDIERADGSRGNIIVSAAPLRDGSGSLTGAIVSVEDVTDYVELRVALNRSLEETRKESKKTEVLASVAEATKDALNREMESSHLLQRALLPEEPDVGPGYKVAHTYMSGAATAGIGGDFYDTFVTKEGKVGILIGDVSGKGLEAAALAVATRSTVRAFAYEIPSPSESLRRVNDVLAGQGLPPGVFVTVFLIILDPSSGNFSYASAGHPPAAICRADAGVNFLEVHNTILGILDKLDYQEEAEQLLPGDKIILYTDGISEAHKDTELFGTERMEEVLDLHGSDPPDTLINELVTAAEAWAKGNITDDVAVMVVERI